MKVFRRIFALLLVVALMAAMPPSAFAASASRTVRYGGYDYECYAQCGSSTAYASTETDCSTSKVKVRADVREGTKIRQWLESNPVYGTASVYFPSLTGHNNLYARHYVLDVDGTTLLLAHTVNCP